jgi:hypothetical protein
MKFHPFSSWPSEVYFTDLEAVLNPSTLQSGQNRKLAVMKAIAARAKKIIRQTGSRGAKSAVRIRIDPASNRIKRSVPPTFGVMRAPFQRKLILCGVCSWFYKVVMQDACHS